MNKQFLSLLLLASFVPATTSASVFAVPAVSVVAGVSLGSYFGLKAKAAKTAEVQAALDAINAKANTFGFNTMADMKAFADSQGLTIEGLQASLTESQKDLAAKNAYAALSRFGKVKANVAHAYNVTRNGIVTGAKAGYNGVVKAATVSRDVVKSHPKVAAASIAAGLIGGVAYQNLSSNPTKKKTATVSTISSLLPVAFYNREALWNATKTGASFVRDTAKVGFDTSLSFVKTAGSNGLGFVKAQPAKVAAGVATTAAVLGLGYLAYKKFATPRSLSLTPQQAVNLRAALAQADVLSSKISGNPLIVAPQFVSVVKHFTAEQTGLPVAVVEALNQHVAFKKALNEVEYIFEHHNGRVTQGCETRLEVQKALQIADQHVLAIFTSAVIA